MIPIRLEKITKRFGQTIALDSVDLSIAPGELFFLLGPSGCGKSTLLRIVAGLLEPTAGRIFFGDRDVTGLGTEKRNAVMCFQSYALWPHMTVAENVRFGLEVRGIDQKTRARRVEEVLGLVQMQDYADRRPNQLSGGQQQRVALARALAVNPDCLLLDEPLSNLDAKLRQEMRSEIRRICKAAGTTTLYVTHDQKEALSVADRLAVMRAGRIAQVGTPAELYHAPRSAFVAAFIGQTNLLPGRVIGRDGETVRVDTPAGPIVAAAPAGGLPAGSDGAVILSIRPEQFRILREPAGASIERISSAPNRITGRTIETTFLGESSEHVLLVGADQSLHVISTPPLFQPPSEMVVEVDSRDVVILPDGES